MPSPIGKHACDNTRGYAVWETRAWANPTSSRSEEHTSELQSRLHLVCRLLLEKKKDSSHPCMSLNASIAWPAAPLTCMARAAINVAIPTLGASTAENSPSSAPRACRAFVDAPW